jgi:hypothetical protein
MSIKLQNRSISSTLQNRSISSDVINDTDQISGEVCTVRPGFRPHGIPVDIATAKAVDEGERLLELTKDLHQRVYTAEQRLNMLSNKLQAQSLKLSLLAR